MDAAQARKQANVAPAVRAAAKAHRAARYALALDGMNEALAAERDRAAAAYCAAYDGELDALRAAHGEFTF